MVSGIIVAAGKGSRMGADINKVFLKLAQKTVIEYTLDAFEKCADIDETILVISRDDEKRCKELEKKYPDLKIVFGGAQRKDSVLNGINAASGDVVAIHDGARALITPELISKVVSDGKKYGAATLGVPSKDTVKIINDEKIVEQTPNRTYVYQTQTPQVFLKKLIKEAHEANKNEIATDDASLAEMYGKKVKMTEGSYENIKITTPEDLLLAEEIVKRR